MYPLAHWASFAFCFLHIFLLLVRKKPQTNSGGFASLDLYHKPYTSVSQNCSEAFKWESKIAFLPKFIPLISLKRKGRCLCNIWDIVYTHDVFHNQVHLFLCASTAHYVQVIQFGCTLCFSKTVMTALVVNRLSLYLLIFLR